MVGKPNQAISKAGLQPIPVFDEPFSWIMIDSVDPLSKTKPGTEYVLTIMCASTQFPEALPFSNLNVTPFNVISSVPKNESEVDCEVIDCEEMNFTKSDPTCSKLQISEILKDLDKKHLDRTQRY